MFPPRNGGGGQEGKKKEAIIILLQLVLYLSSSVSFIPSGILAGALSAAAYSEDGLTDADLADAGESPPSALEWAGEQLIGQDLAVKDTGFCRIRPR